MQICFVRLYGSQGGVFVCVQLRQEKIELEETLEKEQEAQINKLMRKIEKLEADTYSKQQTLEQVSQWSTQR